MSHRSHAKRLVAGVEDGSCRYLSCLPIVLASEQHKIII